MTFNLTTVRYELIKLGLFMFRVIIRRSIKILLEMVGTLSLGQVMTSKMFSF